jgi:hypothetical protein
MIVFLDHKLYPSIEGLSISESTVTQLMTPVTLRSPVDGDDTFSETSVLSRATRYNVPEVICNRLRVFENRVLEKSFGPKRDGVRGGWRKLHNEELQDLYSSPSIIRIIKSRRMRWSGHVARMGRRGTCICYW